jgi:hypothetical protein
MLAYVVRIWIGRLGETDYIPRSKASHERRYENASNSLHLNRLSYTIGIL